MQPRNFHLGYFLKIHHLQKAIELLNIQLDQINPLYNNLDFSLYKQEDLKAINSTKFYNDYISNDACYYFENLFFTKKYYSAQKAYKIREFNFLSLSSQILYYSVGMYLRELLDKRLDNLNIVFKEKNIKVYYGGNINYKNPVHSQIYYYEDYKRFIQLKEQWTNPMSGKIKYAISLDIKSFFYSINHSILLDIISELCTPQLRQSLKYDEHTKASISLLFKFLEENHTGLPVSNQSIISSFLSSVYFSLFDLFVVNNYLILDGFYYIRYVDDFYLIMDEDDNIPKEKIREKLYDIENDFTEYLINKLELSVSSSKCDRYEISDRSSQINFLKCSSLDNYFDIDIEDDNSFNESILLMDIKDKNAPEIFDKCIDIIKDLKEQSLNLPQLSLNIKESTYLNFILINKECLNYSKSPEARTKIKDAALFDNITSIDFILTKPKVLLHLITIVPETRRTLFEFIFNGLQSLESLTQKLSLLDKFIHQLKFLIHETKNEIQKGLLSEYEEYTKAFIECLFIRKTKIRYEIQYLDLVIKFLQPNYSLTIFQQVYNFPFLNNELSTSITQQIKLRKISERLFNYNVCFNHLLNEFQNLFEQVYYPSQEQGKSTALNILNKMSEKGYNPEDTFFINSFFERRNQNSISHTNQLDIGLWTVTKDEYIRHKDTCEPILNKLYKLIELS